MIVGLITCITIIFTNKMYSNNNILPSVYHDSDANTVSTIESITSEFNIHLDEDNDNLYSRTDYPHYYDACQDIGRSLVGRCVENTISDLEDLYWRDIDIFNFLKDLLNIEKLRLNQDEYCGVEINFHLEDAVSQIKSIEDVMTRYADDNHIAILYIADSEYFSDDGSVHENTNETILSSEQY